jgi:hypothetical protein
LAEADPMIDRDEELADAVTAIPPERLAELIDLGIPEAFICAGPHRIGFTDIETNGDLFEPAETGTTAIVVAEVVGGEVIDLIAFHPSTPGRWWLRLGAAELLGAENLGERVFPTIIRANPLRWLQGGGRGVCIVNWGFDPLARLAFAGPLRAPAHIKLRLEQRIQEVSQNLFQIETCHE